MKHAVLFTRSPFRTKFLFVEVASRYALRGYVSYLCCGSMLCDNAVPDLDCREVVFLCGKTWNFEKP